ncbi:hypothetical protein [Curtobacterium sp. PhB136]|uniref:hypothetical protein n=1 Tax=Curtobacterium sp. PhB136 TaxID=2485181 RepID=UPI0010488664|nr:hypothetical protein [Curtobacterium sp. PhB136]TCK65835.1 hypothetical protein EDF27_0578 [Curtobacterium sp. PhB136]
MTAPTPAPLSATRRRNGVPATLADAVALTTDERLEVIRRVFLHLEAMTDAELAAAPTNDAGEFVFDSLLGMDLYTEMTQHLGEKPLDLSEFVHGKFETFAGINELVGLAYDMLQKKS